jgi:hypothetical protein
LSSNATQEQGVGNSHDLVGRFFMDHPTATARFVPANAAVVDRMALYDVRTLNGRIAMGCVRLTAETLRREGLLNSCGIFVPDLTRERETVAALGRMLASIRERRLAASFGEFRLVASNAPTVGLAVQRKLASRIALFEQLERIWPRARLLNTLGVGRISGWSSLLGAGHRFRTFELFQMMEQAPERERRITLSSARDDFGRPIAHLHWFVTERELASLQRSQAIWAEAIAAAGLGRLQTTDELARGHTLSLVHPSAHHHLGTTRMHPDPRQGVVDADCRVHGVSNLFAVGTSVFPTGSYVNPTLTAVALATRLADHLTAALGSMPELARETA